MTIEITGAVCRIDTYCHSAFVVIYNEIVLSGHIVELNRRLIASDRTDEGRRLSGYFKWRFTGDTFMLWQRMGYNSEICFTDKILEVKYGSFVSPDRVKTNEIKN